MVSNNCDTFVSLQQHYFGENGNTRYIKAKNVMMVKLKAGLVLTIGAASAAIRPIAPSQILD